MIETFTKHKVLTTITEPQWGSQFQEKYFDTKQEADQHMESLRSRNPNTTITHEYLGKVKVIYQVDLNGFSRMREVK